ncbi:MAG TPA: sugar transferase [Anaerolineae bacterium]|nr:sugar transferase [Anaerolineae bacterium]
MKPKYPRWLIWCVVIGDVVLINAAFLLAYVLRYEVQLLRPVDPIYDNPPTVYIPFMILLTGMFLLTFKIDGVYQSRRLGMWLEQMYAIVRGTTLGILLMVSITFFYQPAFYSRLIFVYDGLMVIVLLGFSRFVWGFILSLLRRRGIGVVRVLVVGAGEVGRTVIRTVMAQPELGYRIAGLIDDQPNTGSLNIGPIPVLGGLENISQAIKDQHLDEVVITLPWTDQQRVLDIIQVCERLGVRARTVPDIFQLSFSRVDVEDLGGVPLLGLKSASFHRTNLLVKRSMDLIIGSLITLIAMPFMTLLAIAIRLDSPGPIIFRQKRIGMHDKEFTIYKFRTMHAGAEEEQERLLVYNEFTGPLFKMKADPRITRMGRFLRKTSLDEVPQLFNVLKGDMSLVGPRPHIAGEVAQYQDWQRQVLEAPPGMAGLSQVSGRSQLSFDEQCLLDIYYIENWSPALDIKILLRTIPKVLSGEGAY